MLNSDLYNNKIFFFARRDNMYWSPTWDTREADNDRVNENCSIPFRGHPRRTAHDDNDAPPSRDTDSVIVPYSQNSV